jgi:hypothetical protein
MTAWLATQGEIVNPYSTTTRIRLLGSSHRLVQPICTILGIVQHHGHDILPERLGEGFSSKYTQDIQF